jgi:hypothetical protein
MDISKDYQGFGRGGGFSGERANFIGDDSRNIGHLSSCNSGNCSLVTLELK